MACISKLASAIAYDCDTGATGLVSALIINKADIESFSVEAKSAVVGTLELVQNAKAYKIDTVKRSLVTSSALKINDGAPNAYTQTANITMTAPESSATCLAAAALTNGSYVVLTKNVNGAIQSFGLYYGLSATGADRSSHDNGGWFNFTLSTPENVIGEDILYVLSSVYDSLYAAAVG